MGPVLGPICLKNWLSLPNTASAQGRRHPSQVGEVLVDSQRGTTEDISAKAEDRTVGAGALTAQDSGANKD